MKTHYWRRCPRKIIFHKSFRFPLSFVWNDHLGEYEHITNHLPRPYICPTCKGRGEIEVRTPKKKK